MTLSLALRCPPTPNQSCLDRIGDQLHADHYVWGTMAKEKAGEVSAELRLWSRGKPQVEASEMYSDNLKDPGDEARDQGLVFVGPYAECLACLGNQRVI